MKSFKDYVNEEQELTLEKGLAEYMKKLDSVAASHRSKFPHLKDADFKFVAKKGRKYIKIVTNEHGRDASVHSFIDTQTGDLLKAASWAAPAKGSRGNILSKAGLSKINPDPYGSYLYRR
jgi:hypothetical protein